MAESERYRAGYRIFEKYELIRKLDQGGMGTVWVAKNADLDVHVALKLLRAELSDTPAADRLLAEARMLARLQHPAIVRVHDCGRTERGDPFVVMELLDGESLADTMERRARIPALEAVSLLLPIVDGMRVAHEAGIVHRDVKPENIFLARVGGRSQPKLLDFGIALAREIAVRRTTHGAVMGSPVYMSPEQARGAEVGASTDLWALAVVLFEMVTGALPFKGDNYNAVLRAIIEDDCPSLTALAAGDELLAAIVERALSKDPARRWHSARELGTALAEWLAAQGLSEDVSQVSLRSWLVPPSEPPTSLRPVIIGSSDRPPSGNRITVTSPLGTPHPALRASLPGATVTTDGHRSLDAFTRTSIGRGGRGWGVRLATAAGAAVLITGGIVWFHSMRSVPAVSTAPNTPDVSAASKSTRTPAPSPARDAGANATEAGPKSSPTEASGAPSDKPAATRETQKPTSKPVPRHERSEPRRTSKSPGEFRPRGI